MTAVFIAGAGTDVGKTFVASHLIRALCARGVVVEALKPVVSGLNPRHWADSDPGQLLAALGRPLNAETLAAISPWRFAAPLSPEMAARREGQDLDCTSVVAFCQLRMGIAPEATFIIEGVGGVMSPIDERATGLDLMAGLDADVVLVTGSYLGAISHALTAVEAVRQRGLSLGAIVVSESPDAGTPFDETVEAIAVRAGPARVFTAPRNGDIAWREALADMVMAWTHAPSRTM